MIYGYIRVSTDKQTVENQRFEIKNYCKRQGWKVDKWISEITSGTKEVGGRKLGELLLEINEGDTLVCSEISRLGRSMFMILDVFKLCLERGIKVHTIKDNYILSPDPMSKLIASIYGYLAEMERTLISQRTKEGLKRRAAEGQRLGRQVGSKNKSYKLDNKKEEIQKLLSSGISRNRIAKLYGVHWKTVVCFVERLKA